MRACKPSPYVYVELFQKSGQMLSWVRPGWGGAGVLTFSDIDIVVFVIVGEDAGVFLPFQTLTLFSPLTRSLLTLVAENTRKVFLC